MSKYGWKVDLLVYNSGGTDPIIITVCAEDKEKALEYAAQKAISEGYLISSLVSIEKFLEPI